MSTVNDPRFPVGKFSPPADYTSEIIRSFIRVIREFPKKVREETSRLDDSQLDTPYRDGGWTIRQVVHHVADSHMNSYCRFKLALTEDNPVIKPYLQDRWAETADGKSAPVFISLNLLDAVHARWIIFLESLGEADLQKTFFHPEHNRPIPLNEALAIYAWHCDHHLAHITVIKKIKKW